MLIHPHVAVCCRCVVAGIWRGGGRGYNMNGLRSNMTACPQCSLSKRQLRPWHLRLPHPDGAERATHLLNLAPNTDPSPRTPPDPPRLRSNHSAAARLFHYSTAPGQVYPGGTDGLRNAAPRLQHAPSIPLPVGSTLRASSAGCADCPLLCHRQRGGPATTTQAAVLTKSKWAGQTG
jgi:hypothetical protein